MSDQNVKDFINAAFSKKPVEARDAFTAGVHERLGPMLQAKKTEVTQTLFNGEAEVAEEIEDEDGEYTIIIDDDDDDDLEEGIGQSPARFFANKTKTTIGKSGKRVTRYMTKGGKTIGSEVVKRVKASTSKPANVNSSTDNK